MPFCVLFRSLCFTICFCVLSGTAQAAVTAPAAVRAPDGSLFAYTQGSDGQVYERQINGGSSNWDLVRAGPTTAAPAAAVGQDGTRYVVVRGSDYRLYETSKDSSSSWTPYAPIAWSGAGSSDPALVVDNTGRRFVYVRGADGYVYENASASLGGWGTTWSRLDGSQSLLGPTAVITASGERRVFILGTDQRIYENRRGATGWGVWQVVGSLQATSAPSALLFSDDRVEVYAIGADQRLHTTTQLASAGDWSAWSTVVPGGDAGSLVYSRPAAVATSASAATLLVRGSDNRVYSSSYTSSWSAWTNLGGDATAADMFIRGGHALLQRKTFAGGPLTDWTTVTWSGFITSAPAVASVTPGTYDIAARGTDQDIYYMRVDANGSSGWHGVGAGGSKSSPALATNSSGALDLYVRGTDDRIYHKYRDLYGVWSSWQALGDATTSSSPAATLMEDGTKYVYVRGTDGLIYVKNYNIVQGWSAWSSLGPGSSTFGPAAIVASDGGQDVFVTGSDGRIYSKHLAPGGNWPADWALVSDGTVLSAPVVIAPTPVSQSLFARGTDGNIYAKSRATSAGPWSSWGDTGTPTQAYAADQIAATAGALTSDDASQFAETYSNMTPWDRTQLLSWLGPQSDWNQGTSIDNSDVDDGYDGDYQLMAHWGWFHAVRSYSDAKAYWLHTQIENASYVAAAFGLMSIYDPPAALVAGATALTLQVFARRIERARERADGRGVRIDIGFRCQNIPFLPDPCWPAYWTRPR